TPLLKPITRRMLSELLPPGAAVNNPVDFLPTRTPEQVAQTLEIIARQEGGAIDYILIQVGSPGFTDNWPVYKAIINAMDTLPLPIFPSFSTSVSAAGALLKYRAAGKCHFEDEVSMARAVGRMVNRPRISPPAPDSPGYNRKEVAGILKDVTGVVPPDQTRRLLQAAGIPLPGERRVNTRQELAKVESVLPPPWVMKVIGPLHKSDLGGVMTGVLPAEAEEVFERLMKIEGAQGVLVQETVQGPEVIMGLSQEEDFGHLVAFGLGGVTAEALGDIKFGLSPLCAQEAERMIKSIRALPILEGYRGRPGVDIDLLADLLVRVSLLGRDIPKIKEMDLNPVKGVRDRIAAVDVRIIVQ
ncbi:MAG: acetate--CoA ligase family protein, partial [Desulfobacterales bacterium]